MTKQDKVIIDGNEYVVQINENKSPILLRSDAVQRINQEGDKKMKVAMKGIPKEINYYYDGLEPNSNNMLNQNNFQSLEDSAELLKMKVLDGMLQSSPTNQQLADTMLKNYNSDIEFTKKGELEEKKALLKAGNAWEKEIIRVARKTYKDKIAINDEGRIIRIIEIPNTVRYIVKDVSNVADLRLIILRASGSKIEEVLYYFHATINGKLIQFLIPKAELSVKSFRRWLIRNGVKLHVANADCMIVTERILAELIEKATEQILPYAWGWNRIDGTWRWISFDMHTFKEVKNEFENFNRAVAKPDC